MIKTRHAASPSMGDPAHATCAFTLSHSPVVFFVAEHAFTMRGSDGNRAICNGGFAELYDEEREALLGRKQEELSRSSLQRLRPFDGVPRSWVEADLGRWLQRLQTEFEERDVLDVLAEILRCDGHAVETGPS